MKRTAQMRRRPGKFRKDLASSHVLIGGGRKSLFAMQTFLLPSLFPTCPSQPLSSPRPKTFVRGSINLVRVHTAVRFNPRRHFFVLSRSSLERETTAIKNPSNPVFGAAQTSSLCKLHLRACPSLSPTNAPKIMAALSVRGQRRPHMGMSAKRDSVTEGPTFHTPLSEDIGRHFGFEKEEEEGTHTTGAVCVQHLTL